jgi:hypothetical protein
MSSTEILLVAGERRRVEGELNDVEAQILNAARGALLEFVWLTDAATKERIAVNPAHVVMLLAVGS